MASPHQKWAEQQIAVLIELGVDAAEATRSVNWVLDHLPDGADPATYIFSAEELWQDPARSEQIQDSRSDWYAKESTPAKYKRLLDAREEPEAG